MVGKDIPFTKRRNMMGRTREGKSRFETGLLVKLLLLLVSVSMVGCIAAIPVVLYVKSQRGRLQ
jgi:hypothetical protein